MIRRAVLRIAALTVARSLVDAAQTVGRGVSSASLTLREELTQSMVVALGDIRQTCPCPKCIAERTAERIATSARSRTSRTN